MGQNEYDIEEEDKPIENQALLNILQKALCRKRAQKANKMKFSQLKKAERRKSRGLPTRGGLGHNTCAGDIGLPDLPRPALFFLSHNYMFYI